MNKAVVGGVTISDGVASGLELDATCNVTGAAGAGATTEQIATGVAAYLTANPPTVGDGTVTMAKLAVDVTPTNLGCAGASHTHDSWVRVTGSNATTTGQALADIAGLSIALLANSVYEFEAVLMVQSSSTAGNAYGVQYSAAGATVEAQITGTLAAATQKTLRISALNTAATPFVTSGATGGILIKGVITTGANAGNLTIRHYKVTSGTSTVFINSSLWACWRA